MVRMRGKDIIIIITIIKVFEEEAVQVTPMMLPGTIITIQNITRDTIMTMTKNIWI